MVGESVDESVESSRRDWPSALGRDQATLAKRSEARARKLGSALDVERGWSEVAQRLASSTAELRRAPRCVRKRVGARVLL